LSSHQVVLYGGWNIADCVARAYDVEGMHVGTVAGGRIGTAVLRRLKPFDVHLHYTDRHTLPREVAEQLGLPGTRPPRGAYLINTARARIADRDAVVRALESGQLAGYAGDVWFPQPAPADHPWRAMPHHGMTPHISGSTLSAQARYAAGTREIRDECLIVDGGNLAGAGANSYSTNK
jgi:formate dehydrogenase